MIVILTLALGIGANSAVFSMVDRVFLRAPAGTSRPSELRLLNVQLAGPRTHGAIRTSFSPEDYDAISSGVRGTAEVAGYSYARFGGDSATRVRTLSATAEFLPLLGVRAALGRLFTVQEVRDRATVTVISHAFWLRTLGGDSAVVGRDLQIEKGSFTVIGVASQGFSGLTLDATDAIIPLRPNSRMAIVARLMHGTDERRLSAAATVAYRRMRASLTDRDSSNSIAAASVILGRGPGTSSPENAITLRVAGVAAIILLITTANVATLLLLRMARRRREIAVRLALGMTRWRLCSLVVTESLLLAVAGGVAAMAFAEWGSAALRATLAPDIHWADSSVDGRMIFFTAAAALGVGALTGLAPAFQSTRLDLAGSLRRSVREGAYQRSRLRSALVVIQVALSVILVIGAGLFVRSLRTIQAIPIGYDMEKLVFASVQVQGGEAGPGLIPVLEAERRRLASIPDVEGVAISTMAPMQGYMIARVFLPDGDTISTPENGGVSWNAVSPHFFVTTGMRVLYGRDFTALDVLGTERVMIVNQSMAKRAWGSASPIGRCLMINAREGPCTRVVGVVSVAHVTDLSEPETMQFYLPIEQFVGLIPEAGRNGSLVVRTSSGRRSVLRQLLDRDLKARLPASASIVVTEGSHAIAPRVRQWQLGVTLFSALGVLALVVATVGVYSVIAFTVSQRTHELGVRIALGARAAHVVRIALDEGMRLVGVGVALGIVVVLGLGRLINSLLYETSTKDPLVLFLSGLVLLSAGVVAGLLPSWRALQVDPNTVLRDA